MILGWRCFHQCRGGWKADAQIQQKGRGEGSAHQTGRYGLNWAVGGTSRARFFWKSKLTWSVCNWLVFCEKRIAYIVVLLNFNLTFFCRLSHHPTQFFPPIRPPRWSKSCATQKSPAERFCSFSPPTKQASPCNCYSLYLISLPLFMCTHSHTFRTPVKAERIAKRGESNIFILRLLTRTLDAKDFCIVYY